MSDPAPKDLLLASLRSGDDSLWSIIGELAPKDETELRTLLRPHEDAGFSAEDIAVDQRSRLDAALGALTRFELGRQLDLIADHDIPSAQIVNLTKLFDSQAFLRYVNAYLYFGIRFLAGRIYPPSWMIVTPLHPPERDKNEQPLALVKPPKIYQVNGGSAAMDRFLVLQSGDDTNRALRFLDGFIKDDEEPDRFELWLRGLWPELEEEAKARFIRIGDGLKQWALDRSGFYKGLEPSSAAPAVVSESSELHKGQKPERGWSITNPIAARLGLADIYWIARLLRADVTADAKVTYKHASWLCLLALQAANREDSATAAELRNAEEILRLVFDFTCDLVQNSLEITADKEQRAYQPELFVNQPKTTIGWRETFDEESGELEIQRTLRSFAGSIARSRGDSASAAARKEESDQGWSKRVQTGEHPHNLIGLALSGGGIRSATFNLGVLQGLQEFDLLRWIDYLSSVSGGGFIGSWLVANVHNTSHWLGRLTNWDESIAHLRRYSRYLAPSNGVMSADTWTMWFSWLRNAFLIQLTGATCLAALLVLALALQPIFQAAGASSKVLFDVRVSVALVAITSVMVAAGVLISLGRTQRRKWPPALSSTGICLLGVLPAWIGSFLIASLLWNEAQKACGCLCLARYSDILKTEWPLWRYPLGVASALLTVIALASISRGRWRWNALWIGPLTSGALYLEYCGIVWLFQGWTYDQNKFDWYALVFGPVLVLAANAVGVVLFIGFCGRYSAEWIREWWTRFGSWLAMYGTVFLIVGVSAAFGPLWILYLFGTHWNIAGVASAGWVGTVVSALLAGKSDKTSGVHSKSRALQILAMVGGVLFIAGALLLAATLVYALLVNIGTNDEVSSAGYWTTLNTIPLRIRLEILGVACFLGIWFSWFFEINIFGLSHFYRNRLVRCYLGATRWVPGLRKPQPFTGFDGADDFALSRLRNGVDFESKPPRPLEFRGPFPILNCSLNLGGSSDLALQTRHSASFSLTPLRCGADRRRVGYAPTPTKGGQAPFAGGVRLGQAVAISGAAASPNMGYNTSPLVAFLLTMFNVRLGWWFPNPGRSRWNSRGLRSSLWYLLEELFAMADETSAFVNVSDGGHFENLGIYELVRRRCKVIIASDAECDDQLQFGSLGNLVRICDTDFGAKIDLDVSSIHKQTNGYSLAHCTVGKITYSNGSLGWLIYLKATVSGDEDVAVTQYRSIHPTFPHESTADQFFSEDQFESYRRLGQHVVRHALRDTRPGGHPVDIAEKLYDVWASTSFANDVFIKGTQRLDEIWERFRQTETLHPFLKELTGGPAGVASAPTAAELAIGLELIQLMEDTFLDLRLDDFWEHPDNRGWAMLFTGWARSSKFRAVWINSRRTFGIRFEYFCEQRLGLAKERPIARVSS
jgi:hypothetical protein